MKNIDRYIFISWIYCQPYFTYCIVCMYTRPDKLYKKVCTVRTYINNCICMCKLPLVLDQSNGQTEIHPLIITTKLYRPSSIPPIFQPLIKGQYIVRFSSWDFLFWGKSLDIFLFAQLFMLTLILYVFFDNDKQISSSPRYSLLSQDSDSL